MEFAKYASEYHINSQTPISSVPGVEKIQYQMYSKTPQGQQTTTLKSFVFDKTVYDPSVWTDDKLEDALKEAFQDAVNRNLIYPQGKWNGVTSQGYQIEGYFRNGVITTFYFIP